MKLLTKYSLLNLGVMVAVFLASSLVLYRFTQKILIHEMDSDLKGVENKIQTYVKQFNAFPTASLMDEEKISYVLTGQQKIERSSEVTRLFSTRENKMHNFRELNFPLWFNNSWYKVTVAKPLEGMHHLSSALITISLIAILFIILISIVLNGLVLRRLWRPFYESMDILRNFKLGKTESLVFPKTTIEEFSFMNKSLLLATGKAKQDYLLLKEFTENASHEIQTPLSIIRSKLDMLIQEKELSKKQSELANGAYTAIKKLSRLNQSLLLLTKIENQQFDNLQMISLKEKIEEKIGQFQELWQSHNIEVNYSLEESQIRLSPELLEILLNNLFSNASNHNIPDGFISIELKPHKFVISNSGLPISLDENRLFSRFYKASVNSNRNGLGLSIIKQISKVSAIDTIYQFADNKHSFILIW
jgi:signal transduction histidine kinase